jgi:adenylate cyclase class IV
MKMISEEVRALRKANISYARYNDGPGKKSYNRVTIEVSRIDLEQTEALLNPLGFKQSRFSECRFTNHVPKKREQCG